MQPEWGVAGVGDGRDKVHRGERGNLIEGEGREGERLFQEPLTIPLSLFPGGSHASSSSSSKRNVNPKDRKGREWLHSEWAVLSGVDLLNSPHQNSTSSQPLGEYLQAAFAQECIEKPNDVRKTADCWATFQRNYFSGIKCHSRFCSKVDRAVSLPKAFPRFFRYFIQHISQF